MTDDADRLAAALEKHARAWRSRSDKLSAIGWGDEWDGFYASSRADAFEMFAEDLRLHGSIDALIAELDERSDDFLLNTVCTKCRWTLAWAEAVPVRRGEAHPLCARGDAVFSMLAVSLAMQNAHLDDTDPVLRAAVLETAYALWRDESRTLDADGVLRAAIALMR